MDHNGRFILNGHEPVPEPDLFAWGRWFERADRIVAKTKVGKANVSTVFLGLDHGFGGKPMLFETMIFGGPHANYCMRYSTWDEAEQDHARIVRALGMGQDPDV